MILQQDAIELLGSCESPTLIFLDPPFNIGEKYEHGDHREDYQHWLSGILVACVEILPKNGSLWLNLPDNHAAYFYIMCKNILQLKLENWCIWHYRFGQCRQDRFISSKTHVLWFSKRNPKVRMGRVLEASDRATTYDDPRVYDTVKGGKRPPLDVWDFSRIQGNNKERVAGQPNQIPEKYMQRIIEVCTDEGDVVVDPFCGSGTTAVVCDALGRNCITGDISKEAVERAKKRLEKGAVRV